MNPYLSVDEFYPGVVEYESFIEGKQKVQFLEYEDGFTLSPKCIISEQITPGIYNIQYSREGIFFQKQKIVTDHYVNIKNEEQQKIVKEINDFREKSVLFQQNGVVHKRGILLHGAPGCGKSSFLTFLLLTFLKNKDLIFIVKDANNLGATVQGLKMIKDVLPEQNIIIVIEEVDKYQAVEQDLLSFLDGQNSLQNMIVLATTNSIDALNPAFLRPSRFDMLIELTNLTNKQREAYLKAKKISEDELSKWVSDTKNFTIAMLKELFISVSLLGNSYLDALTSIRGNEKYQKKNKTKVGFI